MHGRRGGGIVTPRSPVRRTVEDVSLRALDHYERRAVHDVQAWVAGERGPISTALAGLTSSAQPFTRPVEKAVQKALADRRVSAALDAALGRAAEALGDFMVATTPVEPAARAYGVEDHADIAKLHLREVDGQLRRVRDRHRAAIIGLGAVEGVASFASTPTALVAFAASIPAMQAASLRAVADLARHTGFDPGAFAERQFVAEVALRSLEVGGQGHTEAVRRLLDLGQEVATRQALDQLQQHLVVGALRDQAHRFGITLTRRRMAAVVPVVGAVVGAGFNAVHADRLLGGATMLLRARHLARQHDLDLAELIGTPLLGDAPHHAERSAPHSPPGA